MREGFVTVVIPARNEERYISRCLAAILEQSYPSELYTVVVVDNGSSDDTIGIVESFAAGGRIRLMHKAGGTIAAVRNSGAEGATGEFLAFLDADCVPEREWLEQGIKLLQKDRDNGCIGFVGTPPEPTDPWVERTWHHICSTGRFAGTSAVPWLSSFNLIMRRDLFCKVGGFDETLVTCEDVDLGYRLNRHAKLLMSDVSQVKHLDEPKTLRQFFLKEMWRGKSSLRNFLGSTRKREDFLSVAAPVIYFTVLVLGIVAALALQLIRSQALTALLAGCLLVILLAPLLNVFYKTRRLLNPADTARAFFLSAVYLIARGLVVVRYDRG